MFKKLFTFRTSKERDLEELKLFWSQILDIVKKRDAYDTFSLFLKACLSGLTYIHEPDEADLYRLYDEKVDYKNPILPTSLKDLKDEIAGWVVSGVCIKECVLPLIIHYREPLLRKRRMLITKDDYGDYDFLSWHAELERFLDAKVRYEIFKWTSQSKELLAWAEACGNDFDPNSDFQMADFMTCCAIILNTMEKGTHVENEYDEDMTGHDYEHFVAQLIRDQGYEAYVTKGSGDHGVDVIAEIGELRIAIQCKHYNGSVSKAVQEVYTAMGIFDCDAALVISNSSFTSSAKQAAQKLGVILIHHEQIPNYIATLTDES